MGLALGMSDGSREGGSGLEGGGFELNFVPWDSWPRLCDNPFRHAGLHLQLLRRQEKATGLLSAVSTRAPITPLPAGLTHGPAAP